MPPVIAAVGGGSIASLIGKAIVSAVLNYAISFAVKALSPKPVEADVGDFASEASSRTQTLRTAVMSRRVAVGSVVLGPGLTYYAATDNNRYHHLVLTVCDGPVEFGTFFIGDEPHNMEDLDENGLVTAGRYAGLIRLKFHTGAADQVADSDLVAEVSDVDSTFRGRGVAYVYARVDWDRDAMPNGLPNWRFLTQAVVTDPRTGLTQVDDNAALGWRSYVINTVNGLGANGAAAADVDATSFTAAANVCDEFMDCGDVDTAISAVDTSGDSLKLTGDRCAYFTGDRAEIVTTGTAPGGLAVSTDYYLIVVNRAAGAGGNSPVRVKLATSLANARAGTVISLTSGGSGSHTLRKTGEPRYRASGMIESKKTPQAAIQELLSAMNGAAVYSGGAWVLLPAAWRSAVADLDEGDQAIGGLKVVTRHSRRSRGNAVKGKFASTFNDGELTEYPTVTSSSAETEDGGERIRLVYDQPMTESPLQAQRNAGQRLKMHRSAALRVEGAWKMKALALRVGDTATLTNARRSWSAQPFRVSDWSLTPGDASAGSEVPPLIIRAAMEGTQASDFTWDPATEETDIQPKARAVGSQAFSVDVPALGTIASGTDHLFVKKDGTVISRIYVPWTAITDRFVLQRGFVELRYRPTGAGDSAWQVRRIDDLSVNFIYLEPVEDGVGYDIQIRAVNGMGASSGFSATTTHTVVGKTEVPADETGFSAQQNGAAVVFKWDGRAEVDRAGSGIRYYPADQGFVWADATPLTEELIARGTTISTFLVPPGDWTFGIKAYDTSGNESANAATVRLTVTNSNDIVINAQQAPAWPGTLSGLVRHWTGALIPESQSLAGDDDWETFDEFVPNPVSSGVYTTAELDLGFDAAGVRVWGDVTSNLGPGEIAGVADPVFAIDTRLNAGSFDGFQNWTIGTEDFRFIQARITVDTSKGLPVIRGFNPVCDVAERTETGVDQAVAVSGTAVVFAQRFHGKPALQLTADGDDAIAFKASVTETGFTARVFDKSGSDTGGTIDWTATGA